MKYSDDKVKELVNTICERISTGRSLRSVLKDEGMPVNSTFLIWLSENEEYSKQYARATHLRADNMFDEITEIANHTNEDHTPFTGGNVVQRDRLRIDAIKWQISKMNPKKYGDKLEIDAKMDIEIDFTQ